MLKPYVGFFLLIPVVLADKKQDERFIFLQNDYMIKFERMELIRFNDHIMTLSLVTSKYNRTCPVVNLSFSFKTDIGEEPQVIIQAYKFASNEYRTFPLHFQVGFCEAVEKDYMLNGQYMLEFQGMLFSSELYLVHLYMTISHPVKIMS